MKSPVLTAIFALLCVNIFAATLWEEPTVVRSSVNIDWNRCASATNGNAAIYCWSALADGNRNIYAQKVDNTGVQLWDQPVAVVDKPGLQEIPVITRTSAGNYIIVWEDFSDNPTGSFYAQMLNTDGALLWQAGGVEIFGGTTEAVNHQIIPDNNGGAYIAWEDRRNPTTDIYAQHISASGVVFWQTDGIPLMNTNVIEQGFVMLSDLAGGFFLGYEGNITGNVTMRAAHYNSDGVMNWTEPVSLGTASGWNSHLAGAYINSTTVVYTWEKHTYYPSDIVAQGVSSTGNLLWQNLIYVYTDAALPNPTAQQRPVIAGVGNNCVVIVWEDYRNNVDDADLFAQKLNLAGERVWATDGVPVCVEDFHQGNVKLLSDNNGGCFLVWQDGRAGTGDYPYDYIDIYAQALNAGGALMWGANGRVVCDAAHIQSYPTALYINGQIFMAWEDYRLGSMGIYIQTFDQNGWQQVNDSRQRLYWGMSGAVDSYSIFTLPLPDGTGVVWGDYRLSVTQIYYQMVDENGDVALEQDGRSATVYTGFSQNDVSAVSTPDGRVAVVWKEQRAENPEVYAQCFDANGNRMWGDTGLKLTLDASMYQNRPVVSYDNGAFYFAWMQMEEVLTPDGEMNYCRIYGQKVINGQRMWGSNGLMISQTTDNNVMYECTYPMLVGRYFIWERTEFYSEFFLAALRVRLMNADGTSPDGWVNSGIELTDNTGQTVMFQANPLANMTDSGLYIMWTDYRNNQDTALYGQMISPAGQRMWDAEGVQLNILDYSESGYALATSGSEIYHTCKDNVSDTESDLKIQSVSMSGIPLWSETGNIVRQNIINYDDTSLARFDNGGLVVGWLEYNSIWRSHSRYRYIHPDGTPLGSALGDTLGNQINQQSDLTMYSAGNVGYACWSEENAHLVHYSEGGMNDYMGLFLQKISNEVVPAADDTETAAQFTLAQNYPNPFNPSTHIAFSLKANANAELAIYNLRGQKVRTLQYGLLDKGRHDLVWDGRDDRDNPVGSGVYMYRLSSGSTHITKKMILLK